MNQVLGSFGIIQGNPNQTRLITPYADGVKAFSAYLGTATTKLRPIIYADTLQVYYDDITAAKNRSVDVKIIFDHTQEAGAYENPHILARLCKLPKRDLRGTLELDFTK